FVDRIAEAWREDDDSLQFYPAGSWGPEQTDKLLAEDGYHWWPVNGQDEDNVIWISGSSK
ncbi:glucose-6-phosphate dehydrogenase, partial [Paenibacillus sepulcri]|nr:glucose-6-phosphate dehydrogenase [Paenibacillus sepulcri]